MTESFWWTFAFLCICLLAGVVFYMNHTTTKVRKASERARKRHHMLVNILDYPMKAALTDEARDVVNNARIRIIQQIDGEPMVEVLSSEGWSENIYPNRYAGCSTVQERVDRVVQAIENWLELDPSQVPGYVLKDVPVMTLVKEKTA